MCRCAILLTDPEYVIHKIRRNYCHVVKAAIPLTGTGYVARMVRCNCCKVV